MSVKKNFVILCALASVLASVQADAAQPSLRCVIEPERAAELGSPVIGVVEAVYVERGDMVRQGQILARLRSNVERASVGAAEARAQADADVQAAHANYEFQKQKLARTEELTLKKFMSAQALEQTRAETSVAEQRLKQAREQKRIAQQELESAQAQLSLRAIRAPFAGIVADRFVNPGERVEVKPLFRIAKTDLLRVEIIAPAAMYGSIKNGMPAQIVPEIPNAPRVDAKVVLVDKLIDAASNTFRVRAELPNAKGAVPSGSRCKAELPGASDSRQADAAPKSNLPSLPQDSPTPAAQPREKTALNNMDVRPLTAPR
jgi:RND family efflux transporter MFP subunit